MFLLYAFKQMLRKSTSLKYALYIFSISLLFLFFDVNIKNIVIL